jgi:NAD(P)H-quinone oxidoreductase subunit 5
VLLLHFAPLLVQTPAALLLLSIVGTLTAAIGMIAMWAQTNVKRTLAWSTVSQMGFMMVQFGLAAFPAAILHLVGHGCYKAWSFLRTGGLPLRTAPPPKLAPRAAVQLLFIGSLAAIPALALGSMLTGFNPLQSPGKLALTGIVALSLGQLWISFFQAPGVSRSHAALLSIAGTFGGALLACALYEGAALFFAPALGVLPIVDGPLAWLAAILPLVVCALLSVLYAVLPLLATSAAGRAFYVHALHGFYVGAIADRLVERVWGGTRIKEMEHA